jgi:hypothetical protein
MIEEIRTLVEGVQPVTMEEARTAARRRHKSYVRAISVVASLAVLAGIVGTIELVHRPRPAYLHVGAVVSTTTGVLRSPMSARIALPSPSIVAGSSEPGTLVIENNTGVDVRLTTKDGCMPPWGIVLANNKLPQTAIFSEVCTLRPLVIGTGVTKLPFTLRAIYQGCSNTGEPQGALLPVCLRRPDGSTLNPPLPSGLYRATFFMDGAQFTRVTAVPIGVVSRSSAVGSIR